MQQSNIDNPKKYLNQALDYTNKAVEAEKNSDYSLAYQFYSDAIEKCKKVGVYKTRSDIKILYDNLFPKITKRVQELENAGYSQQQSQQPQQQFQQPPPQQQHHQPPATNQPKVPPKSQASVGNYKAPSIIPTKANRLPSKRPPVNQNNNNNNNNNNEDEITIQNAIMYERPSIRFSDVAGLDGAKQALNEAVIMPIRVPHLFDSSNQPWRGILLYGPPGTGKSFLAKAVAGEANDSTFLTVSTADLTSKWVGESEKLIKSLFRTARENRPSVIFLDEIDSLVSERGENDSESGRRIKTEFLVQMDGVGNDNTGVLVIAATNLPWVLDQAMRRRFEKRIYVPLPDKDARRSLLKGKLKDAAVKLSSAAIERIANSTEGFSGADIGILVRDALMQPIREVQSARYFKRGKALNKDGVEADGLWVPCKAEDNGAVKKRWNELNPDEIGKLPANGKHFAASFNKTRPSVAQKDILKYEKWTEEYGEEGS